MSCACPSLAVYWLSERGAARERFLSSFRPRGVQSPSRSRSQQDPGAGLIPAPLNRRVDRALQIRLPTTPVGVHTGDMMTGAAASKYDERIHPFAMQPCSLWLRGNGTNPG